MKKVAMIVIAVVMLFTTVAMSAESVMTAKVESMTVALDKNGKEYVRCIITENRTAGGVEYSIGVPVMFFGDSVKSGKLLKAGDTLKAVVQHRIYQGAESYSVIKILK